MDRGVPEAAEIFAGGYIVDESVRRTLDVSVVPEIIVWLSTRFARSEWMSPASSACV